MGKATYKCQDGSTHEEDLAYTGNSSSPQKLCDASPEPAPKKGHGGTNKSLIAMVIVLVILVICLLLCFCYKQLPCYEKFKNSSLKEKLIQGGGPTRNLI